MNTSISFPEPEHLYITIPQAGAITEGRQTRAGQSGMKIGYPTKTFEATDFRWEERMIDDVPGIPIKVMSYRLKITTFPMLNSLGDIKRYDTFSWWFCSWQEILRHLSYGTRFLQDSLWNKMQEIKNAELLNIHALFSNWLKLIVSQGDFSKDHFIFYAKEHEGSATPWGGYWGDILLSNSRLNEVQEATKQFIIKYAKWYADSKPMIRYIKAEYTYPGLRARPGDYKILGKNNYDIILYVEKWRDRKVGGITGLSQLTMPLYKLPIHKITDKLIHDWIAKFLQVKVNSLSELGPDVYVALAKSEGKLFLYDMKVAEKLTGMLLQELGFSADLSEPRFTKDVAAEMYSGIGPTPLLNEIALAIILKAIMEEFGIKITILYIFSDNFAVDVELPASSFYDKADEFCGFNPISKKFAPMSLVTDNPKNRVDFNGKYQKQVQLIQYIMRPFLGVMMNSLSDQNACMEFLEYVLKMKYLEGLSYEADSWRKDHIKELLLSSEFRKAHPEAHKDFMDRFPAVKDYVKTWWITQSDLPDWTSDLRIL